MGTAACRTPSRACTRSFTCVEGGVREGGHRGRGSAPDDLRSRRRLLELAGEGRAEGLQIAGLAAGDERIGAARTHRDLLVDPRAPGIADVGAQTGPRGE